VGVEIAGALAAVPTLECAEGGDANGRGVDIDGAVADGGEEAREAEEAVGVDTVAGGFREEAGTEVGTLGSKALALEDVGEGLVELGEWDSGHV
jgi:hypothetical protein